jgi:hypothetical protein
MDTGLTIVAWATIVVGYALVLELLGAYRRAWSACRWLVGLPMRRHQRRQEQLRQRLIRQMPPLDKYGLPYPDESPITAAPPPTTEVPLTAQATRRLLADILNLETAGVLVLVPLPTGWERLSVSLTDDGFSVSIGGGSMKTESPLTFGSMSALEEADNERGWLHHPSARPDGS